MADTFLTEEINYKVSVDSILNNITSSTKVILIANALNASDNIGLVVGATQTEVMEDIRELSTGLPWLIPGVGTQQGDLEMALTISHQNGMGIINISRGILYAGNGCMKDIIQSAKNYTERIQDIIWNPVNC